jgi:nitrilase
MDVELGTKYVKNSLSYDSPEMARICTAARTARIAVVLGFSENDHNSLYIAQCIINASGTIVMKRRKIKPTHMERTVYGDGDGTSLNNVVEVEGIGRVGGLNCWEHMQPLLKYHTNSQHEEIHVAAWPPMHLAEKGVENKVAWGMSSEGMYDSLVTNTQAAIPFSRFQDSFPSLIPFALVLYRRTNRSPLPRR